MANPLTTNRGYPLATLENNLAEEWPRLAILATMLDTDVQTLFAALSDKASLSAFTDLVTGMQLKVERNAINGYAGLDANARLPAAIMPTGYASLATQAFVDAAIDALVNGSGAALDTLKELAAALGDDPNFAASTASAIAAKADAAAVTAALAGKAATSHSHAIADVTGLAAALNPSSQTGPAPFIFARGVANFNGIIDSGTYTQAGSVITLTATAHGLKTGETVPLVFTTGTAVSGSYVVTATGVNTFTVAAPDSKTTSGNWSRTVYIRGQTNIASIIYRGVGRYSAVFAANMPNANYSVFGTMHPEGDTQGNNCSFGAHNLSVSGFDFQFSDATTNAYASHANAHILVIG